jgi:hypothetical protein
MEGNEGIQHQAPNGKKVQRLQKKECVRVGSQGRVVLGVSEGKEGQGKEGRKNNGGKGVSRAEVSRSQRLPGPWRVLTFWVCPCPAQ